MFPDDNPATITLQYKSGQRHVHTTDVLDARMRATTAIRRKSVRWVRVDIPDLNSNRVAVSLWEPTSKWTTRIQQVPASKA